MLRAWYNGNSTKNHGCITPRKRPLWIPMHKLGINIKTDLIKTWCQRVDKIQMAQDRVKWQATVNTGMDLQIP